MPDWTYLPILRPVLFRMPPETARDLTLGATGLLAALPFGKLVINTMGHMHPPASLKCSSAGLELTSPVGLGAGLDTNGKALAALQHFGFGFLEVGPVTLKPIQTTQPIRMDHCYETIRYPDTPVNAGLDALVSQLSARGRLSVPVGVRLGIAPGSSASAATDERRTLIRQLSRFAQFFSLDYRPDAGWSEGEWHQHFSALRSVLSEVHAGSNLWLCVPPDLDSQQAERLVSLAVAQGISTIIVGDGMVQADGYRLVGPVLRDRALALVRSLHMRWGDTVQIVAAAGIHEPLDALDFLTAGAKLLQLHSGLVYSGPGLPKRINEAIAYYCPPCPQLPSQERNTVLRLSAWTWIGLLSLGLIVSSAVIGVVALTRTVLPYDEAFVGLTRADLMAINRNLLPFMAHDRVTVAGTMIATGLLYAGLALFGLRDGLRWVRTIILVSGAAGFLSFFLFLGFGYFDPVHALLTVGLLPLFILGMRCRLPAERNRVPPNLRNNLRWRLGLWGQLLFVSVGAGLLLAGFAISLVGVTQVFVPQDLHFIGTTAEALRAANPRLLPLIAHDRAGFGGDLVSVGFGVLLLSLWGFRQGARWVWWTLELAGLPGFIAALGIHLMVGYLDLEHLFPAIVAVLLFSAGLGISLPFLYWPDQRYQGAL